MIKKLIKGYPVLSISGPRQSGKTTLCRDLFPQKAYISFENPDVLENAKEDPRGFLARYPDGAIFDEVQRFPELISYLQQIVDERKEMGMYILTGSQQFNIMSKITQSLAGRSALVELLPFSLGELYKTKKPSLDTILWTGLYPPIHDRKLDPDIWYANYLRTYIERDVRQLINIRDLSSFQRFMRLCAGRTANLLNLSSLASDTGISHNTAKAWISILEASYIIHLLPPHFENFKKRLVKTAKLYFIDTGLAAWLLSIKSPSELNSHSMRGALFENHIIVEFLKKRLNQALPSNLYFWRNRKGLEIDLIIDNGEALTPIEIKSGATLNSDFYKGLIMWNKLAGRRSKRSILIYGGDGNGERNGILYKSWKQF